MPLTEAESQLIGSAYQDARRRQDELEARLNRIESRPATDSFHREMSEAHDFLRGRGISPEEISRGEDRMVKGHIGDYGAAYQLGMFGRGRPVLGGVAADRLKMLMEGDMDAATDLLVEDALAEVRGQ